MSTHKLAVLATTALAGTLLTATAAFAQSTGSQAVDELVVTASSRPTNTGGVMTVEDIAKTRSTITSEYIQTQAAGQSALQILNSVPGVNFTNNDAYGSSGGDIRIRSFDNARISLLWDGVPLNDTGNYAIFSNQLLDPENIERIQVNVGTTDVDSPTASATGGTIDYITKVPSHQFGAMMEGSLGSFKYDRIFAKVDSGDLGPWGTRFFVSASWQDYDKFKGPGSERKIQFNGRLYQPIGDKGDFMSVAFHWNNNRNDFYRNPTLPQLAFYGYKFDELPNCVRPVPGPGVQDEGSAPNGTGGGAYLSSSDNPTNPSACTNYYNLRINPSNTGNIRGQSSFHITDRLVFTFDPSFQYVLANGGGTTVIAESGTSALTKMMLGNSGLSGFDLNGDGDTLDFVRFYTPNTTNTHRYGLNTSLIWHVDDNNIVRVAYTGDYGRHRQTGEWTYLDADGNPLNVFGGRNGPKVLGPQGYFLRQRDRYSIAILNQFSVDYNGKFFDDTVKVDIGLRAPFFRRDLSNYCYTNKSGFGYCTTATVASTNADGTVILNGQPGVPYLPPFQTAKKYQKLLPNVGVSWRPFMGGEVYGSFAEGLSAPRTDNLYNFSIPDVQPETTKSYDVGFRYHNTLIQASIAGWYTQYQNRIVTSFDQDLGINIDRNVGQVDIYGVDAEFSVRPNEHLYLYTSASYNHSEVKNDLLFGTVTIGTTAYPFYLPTSGKRLVETPDWTWFGRAEYKGGGLTAGIQAKYVGRRFGTDANDESVPAYWVADLDVRYDLGRLGFGKSSIQLNVMNLFNEQYLGSISSQTNVSSITVPVVGAPTPTTHVITPASLPTYAIAAPRTIQVTLTAAF